MAGNKRRPSFEKYMIRPIFYQVFTRVLISLCLALLWNRFMSAVAPRTGRGVVFLVLALFYALLAWFAYLRMDGINMPKFDRKLFRRKKNPERAFGDMIDYVDEPIVSFDALDDSQKNLALLISNLITTVIFGVLSCLV